MLDLEVAWPATGARCQGNGAGAGQKAFERNVIPCAAWKALRQQAAAWGRVGEPAHGRLHVPGTLSERAPCSEGKSNEASFDARSHLDDFAMPT